MSSSILWADVTADVPMIPIRKSDAKSWDRDIDAPFLRAGWFGRPLTTRSVPTG
jgi:hypothetical protein